MKSIIGVDIGGTNVRVALGNGKGQVVKRLKQRVDKSSGPEGISCQILRMIYSLTTVDNIRDVEIAAAGPLDPKGGAIINSPHFDFDCIPIVKPIEKTLKLPVHLTNDCVAGVVGEKEFGTGKKCPNLVYVTISSGIGAGVFVDNHLLVGKDGNAHEIGHMTIDLSGRLTCGCGKKGHWEAYCGGDAASNFIRLQLESKSRKAIEASQLFGMSGGNLGRLSSKDLFDSAKKGDKLALEIVKNMGRLNAIGFANIVSVYDPELITVGGAIALSSPGLILGPIKQLIDQYSISRIPKIRVTELGENAVLYGALRLSEYVSR